MNTKIESLKKALALKQEQFRKLNDDIFTLQSTIDYLEAEINAIDLHGFERNNNIFCKRVMKNGKKYKAILHCNSFEDGKLYHARLIIVKPNSSEPVSVAWMPYTLEAANEIIETWRNS